MLNKINQFFKNEDGATAIEYGLIAALVSVSIYAGVKALGTQLTSTFGSVTTNLKG